jgi:hypothetical protein
MDELALERVASSAAMDPGFVAGVVSLVNAAYDAAEVALWHKVLEPDPPQDHQVRLRSWYAAIGYRPTSQLDLADIDPESVPHARFPTHVVVMRKNLATATQLDGA